MRSPGCHSGSGHHDDTDHRDHPPPRAGDHGPCVGSVQAAQAVQEPVSARRAVATGLGRVLASHLSQPVTSASET